MQQPRKWWIGLPVLAGLVYLATQSLTPRIEADLRARATAALPAGATVVVVGRDAALSGLSPEAAERAVAALRGEPGFRKVTAPASTPAVAPAPPSAAPPSSSEPYVFSAIRRESLVALTGQLPSDDLRKRVLAKAAEAGAGLAVSDATRVAAGAPAGDYAAALAVALETLGRLSQGRVALVDRKLSIEGEGRENVRAETIAAEARARLPQGFELDRVEVAPGPVSPFVFEAAREGAKVALSGYAPDEATRKRLVEAAQRRFFDASVEDRLELAKGAPQNFADAAESGLTALARLDAGRLAIRDAVLSLSGAARYERARADIEAALAARLPKRYTSDMRLVARTIGSSFDAARCRDALAELSRRPIRFEADDQAIAEESAPLLDALAVTVLRCENIPVEVAAHSDSQGIAELARDRNKRRARLVVDRFVKAGVDPARLSATGYGGERPAESGAQNERIEFLVK